MKMTSAPLPICATRQLFALARIVPGGVGDADVVLDDPDIRIDGVGAFLVTGLELVDERNVHTADKAENVRFRFLRGDHSHEVGAFVLLENQRGDVREID